MSVHAGLRARELGSRPHSSPEPDLAFQSDEVDAVILNGPPFCCAWSSAADWPSAHLRLAASGEHGEITVINPFRLSHEHPLRYTSWEAHPNAVFDLAWCRDGTTLASASADTQCRVWDVERQDRVALLSGHKGTVKVIRASPFNPHVFLTGCRDGTACLWDTRASATVPKGGEPCIRPVRTLANIHPGRAPAAATSQARAGIVLEREAKRARLSSSQLHGSRREPPRASRASAVAGVQDPQQSVTAAEFLGEECIATGGSADGEVKVFDLRCTFGKTPPPVQRLVQPHGSRQYGVTSMSLDRRAALLSVATTNSRVAVYSTACLREAVRVCEGHDGRNFYIKAALSPDGRALLSGSSDSKCYLWRLAGPEAPARAYEQHRGEVSAVAWASPLLFATTGGDDCRVRLWRAHGSGPR